MVVLFNPIFPIEFEPEDWHLIDVVCAVFLATTAWRVPLIASRDAWLPLGETQTVTVKLPIKAKVNSVYNESLATSMAADQCIRAIG